MPVVEKLSKQMLENYLREKELRFLMDQDGDFKVVFGEDEDWGCELEMWLIISGSKKEILNVQVKSDKHYDRGDCPRAIMACNQWNATKLYPKAFVHMLEDGSSGILMCEGIIDLEQGIHQELLNDFITSQISGSFAFWKWVHQEEGL